MSACLWWVAAAVLAAASAELEVINQWGLFEFDVPYNYPVNENYTTADSVSNGIELGWDRVFLTIPRFSPGAPLSLAFIPRNQPGGYNELSPKLQPYPSWDWHRDSAAGVIGQPGFNCTGLVSVFRVRADRCNRLWVLDSGILDSLTNFRVACPPKLLIFDLSTDTLVRSVTLPAEVLRPNTLLSNLVLDDQNLEGSAAYGSCDNMFVYMSDTTNPAIIVYDSRHDSAWRLGHPSTFPEPDWGTFRVAGEYFTLMDGIIGLALSAPGPGQVLYYQAFASNRIYSIPTSALKDGPNTGDDSDLPVSLVGHKSSQGAPLAVDLRDGSLVFAPVAETALAAWQPGSADHRVLASDPEKLQFVLDIRSAERDRGTLWMVSTRMQKFVRQTVSAAEVNLRIMRLSSAYGPPAHPPPPAHLAPSFPNLLHY